MKMITSIYNAPIIRESYDDIRGETRIVIKYNGQCYSGYANLAPQDKDFFSEKVGKKIAISRARQVAMKDQRDKLYIKFKMQNELMKEVFPNLTPEERSTDAMIKLLNSIGNTQFRLRMMRKALRKEQKSLMAYLLGQEKMVQSVKKTRDQDKQD